MSSKNKINSSKPARKTSVDLARVTPKVKTYANFLEALRDSDDPKLVVPRFMRGEIRVEPFSRHLYGLAGSLKIGRFVENALFDGAKSVTLTADDIKSIYLYDLNMMK